MDNPYDLYSWSRLYREDALREAREKQLVGLAGADRRARSLRDRMALAFKSVLLGLRPGPRNVQPCREPEASRW